MVSPCGVVQTHIFAQAGQTINPLTGSVDREGRNVSR
jgi:hypothetical protein